MDHADVLVAGAGPGGCAAALGFARRGARVRLLEPPPGPHERLAGEWLHPGGVAALRRLGVPLDDPRFCTNRGFVVHPGPGEPAIALPFGEGAAVSVSHSVLTRVLRECAAQANVAFVESRVVGGRPSHGEVETPSGPLRAQVIVGADGRGSSVRSALRGRHAPSVALSHTAGVLLTGAELPREGFGHLFLGGPGPVLAYRVGVDAVRVCVDVPRGAGAPGSALDYLRHSCAPVLPAALRAHFLARLSPYDVQWAANRFQRRADYGSGRCALVGDAVGHTHPLTAVGMSLALLDGECLGRSASLRAYVRERTARTWSVEHLAAGLHRVLTGQDEASRALRRGLLHLWRHQPQERARSLALLGMTDTRRRSFLACTAAVAGSAATTHMGSLRTPRPGPSPARLLGPLLSWLGWLMGPSVGVPPPLSAASPVIAGGPA
ncbi:FAD-dependent monooxygenase [Streptomyces sp. NPDC001941]|uniref:FAD-dependent monooxygenase n=1 Tax=Streptomyces sp. NPDC001941 TaxID=3154659 RepID=UPI0033337688